MTLIQSLIQPDLKITTLFGPSLIFSNLYLRQGHKLILFCYRQCLLTHPQCLKINCLIIQLSLICIHVHHITFRWCLSTRKSYCCVIIRIELLPHERGLDVVGKCPMLLGIVGLSCSCIGQVCHLI